MRFWLLASVLFATCAAPASGSGGEPMSHAAERTLWLLAAGAGTLTAIATLASMLLVVQRLTRERRAAAGGPDATAGDTGDRVRVHEQHLAEVSRQLAEKLRRSSAALEEQLLGSLRREASSLSEGLRRDLEAHSSVSRGDAPASIAPAARRQACRLGLELARLPDDERQPLTAAFDAAGRLGDWIDRLWPVLHGAGLDVESIPDSLPEAATGEWCQATRTLRIFAGAEAAAFRRLASGSATVASPAANEPPPCPPELAFLDDAGLLTGERPLAERLRRYLEPFDHPGRLGEVTLALQYLLEAFPIEQLSKDRRSRLRHGLSQADLGTGTGEDFHPLIARIAAGIGLHYRPVHYYKSRTDQGECAFVRQQVSPISLSGRVGFEATAGKATIVRLERPFFFQHGTGIYYAGHAHVARG